MHGPVVFHVLPGKHGQIRGNHTLGQVIEHGEIWQAKCGTADVEDGVVNGQLMTPTFSASQGREEHRHRLARVQTLMVQPWQWSAERREAGMWL